MKKNTGYFINNRAQSSIEFAVLLLLIVASLIVMQVYLKRGMQGSLKMGADTISPTQYDPNHVRSDFTTVQSSSTTSTSSTSVQTQTIPSGSFWVPASTMDVEVTTSRTEIHYDNSSVTGSNNLTA